ncbi:MAG: hypothetical protein JNK47_07610 [Mesorhizobium sp.]|nr:glycosyltransferase [Mesorhizobium sp.]MBL8577076.1 hypothetical protein [Mesorhizobium sp.]
MSIEVFDVGSGYEVLIDGADRRPANDFCEVIDVIQAAFLSAVPEPSGGLKIHGGAVALGGKGIFVLGRDRAAVSVTVASLVDQGFRYRGQQCVILQANGDLDGFPGPIHVPSSRLAWLGRLDAFQGQLSVSNADNAYVTPQREWKAESERTRCCAIVIADAAGNTSLQISTASAEVLGQALHLPGRGDGAPIPAALDGLPCLGVAFNNPAALGDAPANLLRMVVHGEIGGEAFERLVSSISGAPARSGGEPPQRSQRSLKADMTIGMACYDDFDGVFFSVQSLRLHHPEILDRVEFLLIDNNPIGLGAKALKGIEDYVPNYRYIPYGERTSTAVRDRIFHEAAGRYVLSMDCHVMFPAGAIGSLINHFERDPETRDLVQGPMVKNSLDSISTHWEPVWHKCMFGTWAHDPAGDDPSAQPFDIPLQGLGVFACRREAWPGFNPAFRGFGGEEGYIHEKFRQRGGRTLCLPGLRWLHRFDRPFGVPYPLNFEDRIRNYYIGWSELGLSVEEMIEHMVAELGADAVTPVINRVKRDLA